MSDDSGEGVSVHNPANNRVAADGIKSLVVIQRSLAAAEHDR